MLPVPLGKNCSLFIFCQYEYWSAPWASKCLFHFWRRFPQFFPVFVHSAHQTEAGCYLKISHIMRTQQPTVLDNGVDHSKQQGKRAEGPQFNILFKCNYSRVYLSPHHQLSPPLLSSRCHLSILEPQMALSSCLCCDKQKVSRVELRIHDE